MRAFAEPLVVSLVVRKRHRNSGQWRTMFPTVPFSGSYALLDVSRSSILEQLQLVSAFQMTVWLISDGELL